MPLPLFLAPVLYTAAAASTSTSTGVAIGGGVLLGGAGVGGVWWWQRTPAGYQPTQAHLDLLEAQRIAIEARISMANDKVEQLCEISATLTIAINAATTSTSLSVEQLHQLTASLLNTSTRLTAAIASAKEGGDALGETLPELKEIAEKIQERGLEAAIGLNKLKEALDSKETLILKTAAEIVVLTGVVSEQTKSIAQLQGAVEEQKIEIAQLGERVTGLVVAADKYKNNCQFFKQFVVHAMGAQEQASLKNGFENRVFS